MVEPDVLFGIAATDRVRVSRLIRFDAQIAFAIGRLAESHRLIVISDSYALKEPMAIVNRYVGTDVGKSVLAFFASSRESRWASALRSADAPEVINLDDFQAELFGIHSQEVDSQAREPGTLFY